MAGIPDCLGPSSDSQTLVSFRPDADAEGKPPLSVITSGKYTLTFPGAGGMTKTCHDFLGWSLVSGATVPDYQEGDILDIYESTNFYPVWEYVCVDIVYNWNNSDASGTVYHTDTVRKNEPYTVYATAPTLTGYTFGGWNTNAGGTGTTYRPGTGTFTPTADTQLYGMWTAE